MKKTLLLTVATCALLIQVQGVHAAPASKQDRAARISEMCKNREVRLMLLHELTNSPERKQETAKLLNERGFYVRYPNAKATGAAEGQTVNRAINNL